MAFTKTGACLKQQGDRMSVTLSSNNGGWSEIGTINCAGRFALYKKRTRAPAKNHTLYL